MSEIFCIRRENELGLAALATDGDTIFLLDLFFGVEGFTDSLNTLIEKHHVSLIWINQLGENEGRPEELSIFRRLQKPVDIREMKRAVKPIDGRIERRELLSSGKLDESLYEQQAKLSERIKRLEGKPEVSADLAAYLCGLVLIESESELGEIGSVMECSELYGYETAPCLRSLAQ